MKTNTHPYRVYEPPAGGVRGTTGRGQHGPRRGSALIVVLWGVALMALLVSTFAFDAHVEARITRYYRSRTKAYYLARSGLEVARMLMIKRGDIKDDEEPEDDDNWFQHAERLKDGLAVNGLVMEMTNGTVTIDIVPEPARRNINMLGPNDVAKEESLERILDVGGVPEDLWPELIESFLDWTDKDDEPRFDGAETEDYYATECDPPYQCKNSELDTVDELLLVKGFTRTILYGGVLKGEFEGFEDQEEFPISGIADLLTVYGSDKININAASPRVLMTLPGVDQDVAQGIIDQREGLLNLGVDGEPEHDPFQNANDLFSRMSQWYLDPAMKGYVSTDAGIYRITCVGRVGGVERVIWCIVEYANKDFRVLRWREED